MYNVCEKTGKTCYGSKRSARRALVGHLGGKTMRVYRCDEDKTHYHITKLWNTELKVRKHDGRVSR